MGYKGKGKIVFADNDFLLIKISNYSYVVSRKNFPWEFHSHFRDFNGAITLIKLFHSKEKPIKPYFITAMKRICADNEYAELTPSH